MLAFFQNILVILVNLYFFLSTQVTDESSLTKKKKLENNIFINATCKTHHTLF